MGAGLCVYESISQEACVCLCVYKTAVVDLKRHILFKSLQVVEGVVNTDVCMCVSRVRGETNFLPMFVACCGVMHYI